MPDRDETRTASRQDGARGRWRLTDRRRRTSAQRRGLRPVRGRTAARSSTTTATASRTRGHCSLGPRDQQRLRRRRPRPTRSPASPQAAHAQVRADRARVTDGADRARPCSDAGQHKLVRIRITAARHGGEGPREAPRRRREVVPVDQGVARRADRDGVGPRDAGVELQLVDRSSAASRSAPAVRPTPRTRGRASAARVCDRGTRGCRRCARRAASKPGGAKQARRAPAVERLGHEPHACAHRAARAARAVTRAFSRWSAMQLSTSTSGTPRGTQRLGEHVGLGARGASRDAAAGHDERRTDPRDTAPPPPRRARRAIGVSDRPGRAARRARRSRRAARSGSRTTSGASRREPRGRHAQWRVDAGRADRRSTYASTAIAATLSASCCGIDLVERVGLGVVDVEVRAARRCTSPTRGHTAGDHRRDVGAAVAARRPASRRAARAAPRSR